MKKLIDRAKNPYCGDLPGLQGKRGGVEAMTKEQWVNWLRKFADHLNTARRSGHGNKDEPEGTLTITMSSTWAQDHATILRCLADDIEKLS